MALVVAAVLDVELDVRVTVTAAARVSPNCG
jgi:hypothetical protein